MKTVEDIDLTVTIGKLSLKNPVLVSSGTFGFGEDFGDFFNLDQLGGIVSKGLSLTPVMGNPPPRLFETVGGLLNSIGLQNPGLETFIQEKLPRLRTINTHLIVNFFGTSQREYAEMARRLDALPDLSGLEMNISCPNIKQGGIAFGVDPKAAHRLVRSVRKSTGLPLIVKLSPNVTDIGLIARSVAEGGADAVSLINTFRAMAINIHTRRPELGNTIGGLSGPAIKPIAVRMVWEVCQQVKIPVIGMGGITKAEDAIEFLLAGASAIQVGTANLIHPNTAVEIVDGIKRYLLRHKISRVQGLIGLFKPGLSS